MIKKLLRLFLYEEEVRVSEEREINYFMLECNLRQEYKECIAEMLEKVKQEAFMEGYQYAISILKESMGKGK